MNTGTVKTVTANGTWKDFYCFEIEVEYNDGQTRTHKKFSKKDNAFVTEGDHITFDVNDSGSMKNVNKVSGSQGQNMAKAPSYQPDTIQIRIERQSSLKLSLDFLCSQAVDKFTPTDVVKLADWFVVYIETGEIAGKKKEEMPSTAPDGMSIPTEEIKDDLPF